MLMEEHPFKAGIGGILLLRSRVNGFGGGKQRPTQQGSTIFVRSPNGYNSGDMMPIPKYVHAINGLLVAFLFCWPALAQEAEHYTRFRDAKWYAQQLQPLREEVAKIDSELREFREARKSGRGTTGAIALDVETEGVNPDAEMEILQKRRIVLLRRIDELEELARHNEIVPGELRTEHTAEEPAVDRKVSQAEKELQALLDEESDHLARARKEVDLLQRDRKLKAQQEDSNPEPRSRRDKPSEVVEINRRLGEEQAEVQESEQRMADLQDRLEDLRRRSPADGEMGTEVTTESEAKGQSDQAKDEGYWRKQFAAIDYKIKTAQSELDILQRELDVALLQYYPNPATAMREGVTRKEINEHRDAIENKNKEIRELKVEREELEDALRHAGGPAGWSR
jgi:hypothetical protein